MGCLRMDIAPGIRLGRYIIGTQLGAGGMGTVYRAEDLDLHRQVAIKFINGERLTHPDARKRLHLEACAASSLNHPHIVTIYEICDTPDYIYIVMEYVKGQSLRRIVTASGIELETVLSIAYQLADALAEAHANHIIHRDIKPENILLNERQQVKLLDFGLAKTIRAARADEWATMVESLTRSDILVGTIPYMSPEQLRGETLDARTDIFSYGIILYEMLTGRHPFIGASSIEVAASILKDEAPPRFALPAGLPDALTNLLQQLLEKQRNHRPLSFEAVKRELEAVRRGDTSPTGDFGGSIAETLFLTPSASHPLRRLTHPSQAAGAFARVAATPVILVLPLETVGAAEESSFIGNGLAYVITTDLARIEGLTVLSKAAGAGRADLAGREPRATARELGATILLEGEVMRANHRIQILARLIDVESGSVIWGGKHEGDEAELFKIQDAVCASVAAALKVNVTGEHPRPVTHPATINIVAFELYSAGRAFLERRDHKDKIDVAIQMFEDSLEIEPDFALAQAGLGEAFWMKYEATRDDHWVERALAASDCALMLDPRQSQVHISLGIVYHGTGKIGRAIEAFERAIELQPLNDDAHRWLGRCFLQQNELERARVYFERAIEIRPGYWDNYNYLGIYYHTLGRYKDAADQFRRVIDIQPDNYHGYNNLGAMYYFLGRYESAAEMHRRAIKIQPDADAYTNLGCNYFYLGKYTDAIEAFGHGIELAPHDDVLYRNLGDALLRTGNHTEAATQYELALAQLENPLAVNPDDAPLLGRRAVYQAKLGRMTAALVNIEQAAALEPQNTMLMYQRAVVHALAGDADAALAHLREALAQGYSRPEAARDPDLESLRTQPEYATLVATPPSKTGRHLADGSNAFTRN